jgi:chemotaxis-related protein WspD
MKPGETIGDAAARLLARDFPPGYREAWTEELRRRTGADGVGRPVALGIFRLGAERFAISTRVVREVHLPRPPHRVPGRSAEVFRGIVSLRGELHLCADLRALLGVAPAGAEASGRARMLVIEREGLTWAFEADEVVDFRRFDEGAILPPQVTVSKAAVHFTDGIVDLGSGASAARLDPERLFAGLDRTLG